MFFRNPTQHPSTAHHAVGIDISDGSLELINLGEHRDGNLTLHDVARVELDPETIVHGIINDTKWLRSALSELLAQKKMDPRNLNVVSALPDNQVIVKTIPLHGIEHATSYEALDTLAHSLASSLNLKIKRPIIRWKYNAHSHGGEELLLFTTDARYVQQWRTFFKRGGMNLVALEMESLALGRALIQKCAHDENIGIIDFGYRHTSLSIFDYSGLRHSFSIEGGGHALTALLARHLELSFADAEKLKIKTKLTKRDGSGASVVMQEHLTAILQGVHESILACRLPLKKIFITGGGAHIGDIETLTESIIGFTVLQGTLWIHPMRRKNISLADHSSLELEDDLFAGAMGLAIRGHSRFAIRKGVNFL